MKDSFLPDLEIIGEREAIEQGSISPSTGSEAQQAQFLMNRFADLVSSANSQEEDFADRLLSNVFQQQFSNKLFDFLGGYVC